MARAPSDDFTSSTKRIIAERSGFICAYPGCFAPTHGPSEDGTSVNIGEAAHITAASPDGPRYDKSLTSESRRDAENGIWMCRTHAALIDRDLTQYTTELLQDWKFRAEDRAFRQLGRPVGCATGLTASIMPAVRVGAPTGVIVDNEFIPHTTIIDQTNPEERFTWFIGAFVVRFAILKKHNLRNVILNHLTAIVHEKRPIPQYRTVMQVYPAKTSLYYVEIDTPMGTARHEFRPARYFIEATDELPEHEMFPPALVLDDDVPAQVAVRFNAKSPGMYLLSLEAAISSDTDRELLTVMPPQWVIFEPPLDDYDSAHGA